MRLTGERNWLQLLPLSLILPAMSACVTGSTAPVVSEYCRIAKPLTFDGIADSAETVRQIERHNSQWVCVCEHDCPKTP